MPVVKALSPAPERITARQEGLYERWDKSGGNSSHILSKVWGYEISVERFQEALENSTQDKNGTGARDG